MLQTISLCDSLHFQTGKKITLSADQPEWSPEVSLVSKAVNLLQQVTGCTEGAQITLKKRIPLVAGLGGDSSNAAATLKGLNQLWRLHLSESRLRELAAQLGSDVPFFLYGGTVLAEGRGEKLTPLPPFPPLWVVLVVPEVPQLPNKTAQLYVSLKPEHFTDGRITEKLVAALKEGKKFDNSLLFNTFENVAFTLFAGLDTYRKHLLKLGAKDVHLAGSGPTLFSLLKDKTQAEDLYQRCKDQGMEAYVAETTIKR